MERVAFLIEPTGQRLSCLLNPEGIVWRRQAGLRRRRDATGVITGNALNDDPLIATGGGVTELELDLLFDVALARDLNAAASPLSAADPGAARTPDTDVREMTRPLWNLAENGAGRDGFGAPPLVRFIWGRAWNLAGLVIAVAERLERFTGDGLPQRSWLRLRLRRVSDGEARSAAPSAVTPQFELPTVPALPGGVESDQGGDDAGAGAVDAVPYLDLPVDPDGLPRRRLDQIAAELMGNSAAWRLIAQFNDIDDPLRLQEGTVLRLPRAHGATAA